MGYGKSAVVPRYNRQHSLLKRKANLDSTQNLSRESPVQSARTVMVKSHRTQVFEVAEVPVRPMTS